MNLQKNRCLPFDKTLLFPQHVFSEKMILEENVLEPLFPGKYKIMSDASAYNKILKPEKGR